MAARANDIIADDGFTATSALAADGALGFDTAVPLTQSQVKSYVSQGYAFCVRYVSRTDATRAFNASHGTADISAAEAKTILAGGLALMIVQHVATTGWVPSPELGQTYGANAARYCAMADIAEGVTVWLDLENIPKGTPHEDITGYCNAWFKEVAEAGFTPGVYIGFDVWLSPDELFFDLTTKHYWKAGGHITDVSHRGYQMVQYILNPETAHEFDKDLIKTDMSGDRPMWMTATAQV